MRRVRVLVGLAALLGLSDRIGAQTPAGTPPTEVEQFRFWLGEWDIHVRSRVAGGRDEWQEGEAANKITSSFGGYVIEEHFDGSRLPKPFRGMSVSVYNPTLRKWQQTWVDDQGDYLDFVGEYVDGKMILHHQAERNGKKVQFRMVFEDIAKDSLNWKWERSADEGKTWLLLLDMRYVRRKPDAPQQRRSRLQTTLVRGFSR